MTNTAQNTNRRGFLRNLGLAAIVGAAGLASSIGCRPYDNFDDMRPRYSQSQYPDFSEEEMFSFEDTPVKPEDYVKNDIKGFGEIRKIPKDKFNFRVHNAYKTEEGNSVVQLGAFYYLIDNNGQLLTTGSHKIKRVGNQIYTKTGTVVEVANAPRSCFDIDSETLRSGFEERNNGVYLREYGGIK